jgi:hypothetical protein
MSANQISSSVYDQIMLTIGAIARDVINPKQSTYFEVNSDLDSPHMSGNLHIEAVLRDKNVNDIVNKITSAMTKIFNQDYIFIESFTYDMADENEAYGIPDSLVLRITIKQ